MNTQCRIAICVPVYNDWESLIMLLRTLDAHLSGLPLEVTVFAVDDGSSSPSDGTGLCGFSCIASVEVIRLVCNLGHQRAVAVGLCKIYEQGGFDAVLVADSDGEDTAEDMVRMIEQYRKAPKTVLVGQRIKRSEGIVFKIFYVFYKILFFILTGKTIVFGNFSLVPTSLLPSVVHRSELWNHFAATLIRSKLPITYFPMERGTRYAGKSSMNFVSLTVHGLSAISVFIENLLARILLASTFFAVVSIIVVFSVLVIKFCTDLAIPGWATTVTVGAMIVFLQSIILSGIAAFMTLTARSASPTPPIKFYRDYIMSVTEYKR